MIMAKRDYPGDNARNRHVEFIMANWNALAFAFYEGYRKVGPGMIVVVEEDFISTTKSVESGIRVAFVQRTDLVKNNSIGERELNWFRKSNPDTHMFVGISRTDEGFSSYNIAGISKAMMPKNVYERIVRNQ